MRSIKYSKKLVDTELSNTKTVNPEKIIETELQELKIDDNTLQNASHIAISEVKKTTFQFAGAYPYLFDALSMLCSENPKYKDGTPFVKDDGIFYHATLTWEDLKYYSLGKYDSLTHETLTTEILKLYTSPMSKCIPLNDEYSMLVKPIQINAIIHKNKNLSKVEAQRQINFRKKKNDDETEILQDEDNGLFNPIMGIDILFFKPLFEASLKGGITGNSFLQLEQNLQAKIISFIKNTKMEMQNPTDKSEILNGIISEDEFNTIKNNASSLKPYLFIQREPIIYRRYMLYLLEHDNQEGNFIKINAKDLMLHVDPQQLDSDKNFRNTMNMRIFVDKANLIINLMSASKLLDSYKEVPIQCSYNGTTKEFTIHFNRIAYKAGKTTKFNIPKEVPPYKTNVDASVLNSLSNNFNGKIIKNAF